MRVCVRVCVCVCVCVCLPPLRATEELREEQHQQHDRHVAVPRGGEGPRPVLPHRLGSGVRSRLYVGIDTLRIEKGPLQKRCVHYMKAGIIYVPSYQC